MNSLILISLVTLGLAGIFLQLKKEFRLLNFFYVLIFTTISIWASSFYSDSSISAIYGLIAIVVLNYGVSHLSILRKAILRNLIPLISLIIFIFFFKEGVIEVLDSSSLFVNKFLVIGALLSVFAFEIIQIKSNVLGKLFTGIEECEISKSIFIMFIGLSAFLGLFAASSFGVLAIAAFFLSASFYRDDNFGSVFLSLLGMMILPLLANISGDSEVNLLSGEVLEGLLFGFFGAYFIAKVTDSDKSGPVGVILSYLIIFSLITMLLLLDVLHSGMGGMDAFIGAIVGVTVSNAIIGKGYSLSAFLVILIAIGTYFPQFMVNDELIEFEAVMQNENQVSEELVQNEKKLELRDLIGSFETVKDSSIVLFVVGEKDETEGAFKKISGVLDLKEDISKSSLKMKLNLDDFTTFNSFRDGSLMEESYFNQKKYSELIYTSSSMEKIDKFTYKVLGEFKMLGVSSLIEVTLQWIEINGTDFILGEGSLDRTLFGMSPSAIEGNIVSFNYRVQLKKSNDI